MFLSPHYYRGLPCKALKARLFQVELYTRYHMADLRRKTRRRFCEQVDDFVGGTSLGTYFIQSI